MEGVASYSKNIEERFICFEDKQVVTYLKGLIPTSAK
jgi:hypothetical protein